MTLRDFLYYAVGFFAVLDMCRALYYDFKGDHVKAAQCRVEAILSIAILTFVGVNQ